MKKQLTEVAQCAKLIRDELKRDYPTIKFTVRSENYSMGNSINVSFKDRYDLLKEIETKLAKYKDGNFDGMTDCYDYKPNPSNLPRTKFLFVKCEVSSDLKEKIYTKLAENFGIEDKNNDMEWHKVFNAWKDQVLWGVLNARSDRGVKIDYINQTVT